MAAEQIALIDLDKLEVHPSNPRKNVGELEELAASIKSAGLIEPLVAVRHNGKYQVVAGSRRLAAARKAKVGSVPVRVMELDEAEARAAALIENLQRKDLDPLEQAEAFRGWLTLTGKTQTELGKAVGLAVSTISNALRLLEAPKIVQDALRAQTIGAEHARVLLTLKSPELATKVKIRSGITVEELRMDVDQANREFGMKGQGAVERAVKALADAKARHPNATITWRKERGWRADQLVDLTKALGTPPTSISGEIRDPSHGGQQDTYTTTRMPTEAAHDKACDCRAFELSVRENYNRPDGAIVFELKRVCVDAKGWKKARPKRDRSSPRDLSPKERAKQEKQLRERAEELATSALAPRKAFMRGREAIYKRLAKGQIPADVARAIVYLEAAGSDGTIYDGDEAARVIAWQRILKMPATKIAALAANFIADRLDDSLVHTPEEPDLTVLEYFGVKVDRPAEDEAVNA